MLRKYTNILLMLTFFLLVFTTIISFGKDVQVKRFSKKKSNDSVVEYEGIIKVEFETLVNINFLMMRDRSMVHTQEQTTHFIKTYTDNYVLY